MPVRDWGAIALTRFFTLMAPLVESRSPGLPVVPRTDPVRDQIRNVIWDAWCISWYTVLIVHGATYTHLLKLTVWYISRNSRLMAASIPVDCLTGKWMSATAACKWLHDHSTWQPSHSILNNRDTLSVTLGDFHHFINGVIRVNMPRTTTRKVIYRSFKHFDPEKFGSELREAPFHVGQILDIHSHMEYFQDLFLSVLDRHAPIKSKVMKTRQCPHMTPEWKSAIYSRNMAYNTYRKNKTSPNW